MCILTRLTACSSSTNCEFVDIKPDPTFSAVKLLHSADRCSGEDEWVSEKWTLYSLFLWLEIQAFHNNGRIHFASSVFVDAKDYGSNLVSSNRAAVSFPDVSQTKWRNHRPVCMLRLQSQRTQARLSVTLFRFMCLFCLMLYVVNCAGSTVTVFETSCCDQWKWNLP